MIILITISINIRELKHNLGFLLRELSCPGHSLVQLSPDNRRARISIFFLIPCLWHVILIITNKIYWLKPLMSFFLSEYLPWNVSVSINIKLFESATDIINSFAETTELGNDSSGVDSWQYFILTQFSEQLNSFVTANRSQRIANIEKWLWSMQCQVSIYISNFLILRKISSIIDIKLIACQLNYFYRLHISFTAVSNILIPNIFDKI